MKKNTALFFLLLVSLSSSTCNKKSAPTVVPPAPKNLTVRGIFLDGVIFDNIIYGAKSKPGIRIEFTEPLLKTSIAPALSLTDETGVAANISTTLANNDSVLIVTPSANLNYLAKYIFKAASTLKSASGGAFLSGIDKSFITQIDSSRKFPSLSDNALLDLVQQQTFKYFWDYGHPVSGLARERSNATPETVTSGGSGFGVMAIVTGINRGFITKAQGLARMQTIVAFLKNTAQKFHGAFPHWLNGSTGVVIPFSQKDNGADLVETSYLMAGLLTARQYFNGTDIAETTLRNDINTLYNDVEWDWFRNGGQNVLYWHWSPNYNWEMNLPIRGWNECLITYVLAASSPTHGIPATVYTSGFAGNGSNGFTNGSSYYSYPLPLGPSLGGPLFFSHYSFLGVNPNGLADGYANYQTQTKHHSLINYEYCKANPRGNFGYSDSCWGLTASDVFNGYTASSPTNDVSVIAPTAALSSFPYTPAESMKALKFFYYVLGDKIFKEYGFVDGFSLKQLWYANSFLAIDQGPIIVMIENYRSQLIWNLFTSCPEVKNGMKNVLAFSAPYL
jgi:hypothetical protein